MLLLFYSTSCIVFLLSYLFFAPLKVWFGWGLHLSCWRLLLNVCWSFCAAAKNETADWEFQSHRQGLSTMGLAVEWLGRPPAIFMGDSQIAILVTFSLELISLPRRSPNSFKPGHQEPTWRRSLGSHCVQTFTSSVSRVAPWSPLQLGPMGLNPESLLWFSLSREQTASFHLD